MASLALHIKDSYYFEVPKALWRSRRERREDFPEFWVRLDPDYQLWEAERIYQALGQLFSAEEVPPFESLRREYLAWKDEHKNFAKPFDRFLRQTQPWFREKFEVLLVEQPPHASPQLAAQRQEARQWLAQWEQVKAAAVDFRDYQQQWDAQKIEAYNRALDGKILIPQPFGQLRNLYEPASGFCISKFMILEVVVAVMLVWLFSWLARRVQSGQPPRGVLANLLEAILLFLRDEVARPAIGKEDADRFVPLLWTIFLFILGCNLMGMVPWAGAPTGAWGVTFAMACVTFGTVLLFGSRKWGLIGFWWNLVPQMELPWYLALLIKPMILVIEILGLLIRHTVLSVRLLANMVAGHLVLLAIMMLAFSVEGAMSDSWAITAVIAVIGSTLFSCLELFVAFLQAYVFVFLSALFIGAAIHHH